MSRAWYFAELKDIVDVLAQFPKQPAALEKFEALLRRMTPRERGELQATLHDMLIEARRSS